MSLVKYIGPYRPGVTVTEADGSNVYCPYNSAVLISDTLEASLVSQQPGMWADGGDGTPVYTPPAATRNVPGYATVDSVLGVSPAVFDVTDTTSWMPKGGGTFAPVFAGVELDYAEIVSPASLVRTGTDITAVVSGLSITFTARSRPVMVRAGGPYLQHTGVGGAVIAEISQTTGSVGRVAFSQTYNPGTGTASSAFPWGCSRRLTLTEGTSYTFVVNQETLYANGTGVVWAEAASPVWLQAIEV